VGRPQKIGPARSQGGFTLIELLVVSVIMVLAYTLAAPLMSSGVSGAELKASARQLAAGMRKARSNAIVQRQETVVNIDVEGRNFQMSGDQRSYRLPKNAEIKLFTAQSELRTDSSGAIRFYPDGGSTGGRITVSANAREFAVDVNWLTGQVSILE
jgi:general secretion pathway protein H